MIGLGRLEDRQLPPHEAFYDTLKEKALSPGEYEHAQSVWSMASYRTLSDYIRLYCEIEVGVISRHISQI